MDLHTYAVLGSTGNCGTALVRNLLQSPRHRVHAYCRDAAKLERLVPAAAGHARVRVFAGSLYDVALIKACVRGARAVFLAVTTNDNVPGCRVGQDSAAVVVEALQQLRAEAGAGFRPPRLVLLSSATLDAHLSRRMPAWFRPVMLAAASHVYADLRRAEALLRAEAHWLPCVYVKPAGLSPDVARGHRLTLDEEESFLSYADLAAAMVETAQDDEGRYDGLNVGVVNKERGVGARFPRGTPLCILMGLVRHFVPWLHPYLPSTGPG